MLFGDKSSIALELVEPDKGSGNGFIFIYVVDEKFGYSLHDYNIDSAIRNVVQHFSMANFDAKNLPVCPIKILLAAFELALEEDFYESDIALTKVMEKNEINFYFKDFFPEFSENSRLESCLFRLADYMFDTTTLLLIPYGNMLRVCAKDDLTDKLAEVCVGRNDFINLWHRLADHRKITT